MKSRLAIATPCFFSISLIAVHVLCCLAGASALAAQPRPVPGPSPGDALFDPSRVIQIEIRLDPKDWHALRTGRSDLGEVQTQDYGV
ncbi:MAG TPA: hypothetical protein VFA77_12905 [Candidatus Eisenbacteria bacterium]|jgi:hypothetical protein|nr:hypothetical protein [Candidatus Eisenbacteria bacterium]